jgi:hypothetical protein
VTTSRSRSVSCTCALGSTAGFRAAPTAETSPSVAGGAVSVGMRTEKWRAGRTFAVALNSTVRSPLFGTTN